MGDGTLRNMVMGDGTLGEMVYGRWYIRRDGLWKMVH